MSDMLSYEIRGVFQEKWYMQEGGNDTFENIIKSWKFWTNHAPDTHYRLILHVITDVILDDTEKEK